MVTTDGITLNGYFVKPGNNIWYIARIKFSARIKLKTKETFSLSGSIGDTNIYIEAARITSRNYKEYNPEFIEVKVFPFEIVFHNGEIEKNISVSKLMFSFSELNWFFNDNIRYGNGNGDKINGSNTILDQIPFTLNRIKYNDLDEISISQSNNIYDSGGVIKVILRSEILLYFNNPKTTMDILKEVFKFRTLFTIFADAYVDFPKVLKFTTANSGVLTEENGETFSIPDYTLWINDNKHQNPDPIKKPFRIHYDMITDEFEEIILKWSKFA